MASMLNRVVVLQGGISSEREVSLLSGRGVADALRAKGDRKSTRLNSSHEIPSRMPSSA